MTTIRAIRQYPRLESLKTLKDTEVYLRKLLVALQEEAVIVSTLYRAIMEGIQAGDEYNVIEILDVLPAAGNAGRMVYLTTDGKIYVDDGAAWVVLVDPSTVSEHLGGVDDPLVDTAAIAALAITTAKIAAAAVEEAKLATGAATEAKIAAGAITVTKIGTDAVETVKIKAGAIEAAKIATGAVEAVKIAAGAVIAAKIGAGAVTTAKLDALSVTAAKIAALTIEAGQIAANAITAVKIAANAVETDKIKALNVTAAKIAADAITADKIAAGTITADEIAAGTITADEIVANTITIAEIAVGTIPDVSCRVYRTGAIGIVTGTWTKIIFEGVTHDTHSGWDEVTGIYTIQVAGTYYIHANIRYADPVANKRLSIRVEKNDGVRAYSDAHTSNTGKCSVQLSHTFALAVDDEIHVETWHNCGVNKVLDPGTDDTYMQINLLHK